MKFCRDTTLLHKINSEIERGITLPNIFKLNLIKTVAITFCLGFLFFVNSVSAATYTVCSSGCNYTTIQAAFNGVDLAPGDTVQAQADTVGGSVSFGEAITIGTNDYGSAAGQITLTCRTGDTCILEGGGTLGTGITGADSSIAYITVSKFTIQNYTSRGIFFEGLDDGAAEEGIIFSNLILSGSPTGIWTRAKSVNADSLTVTCGGSVIYGLYFGNRLVTTGTNPATVTLTNSSVNACGGGSSNGQVIVSGGNITINTLSTTNDTNGAGLFITPATGNINLTGITATGNNQYGVWFKAVTGLITATSITTTGNGSYGIFIQASTLSTGSKISASNASSNGGDGVDFESSSNMTISGVTASSNTGGSSGINLRLGSSSNVITGNTVQNNAWDGITISGASNNNIVTKNVVSGNGTNGSANTGDCITAHDTATGNSFSYNLCYNNKNSGFAVVGTGSGSVYNNTFYQNGNSTFAGTRGCYWNQTTSVSGSWVFKNNICSGNYPYEVSATAAGWAASTLNYNQYYHVGNGVTEANFGMIDGSTVLTYTAYSGNEVNSSSGNPNLSNPTSDLSLLYTSPAIDSGTDVSLTADYSSNSIYGNPDSGAYEYQPPHSLILATPDTMDVGAGARIYGDGKFRDLSTTTSVPAHLKIEPTGGFTTYGSTTVRPAWMDVVFRVWNNLSTRQKYWTETSTVSGLTNTIHTVGDLTPGRRYSVTVDSVTSNITGENCAIDSNRMMCTADSNGQIVFTYTGTYSSTCVFNVIEPEILGGGGSSSSTTTTTTDTTTTSTQTTARIITIPSGTLTIEQKTQLILDIKSQLIILISQLIQMLTLQMNSLAN